MKLVFLSTSDIHGYIMPTTYEDNSSYNAPFGLSRVSSIIQAQRAEYGADHVVVTDSGDCLQGSPLAEYVHATGERGNLRAFTGLYNAVSYDARCLGNHDFNFGLSYLNYYVKHSSAPILTANILDGATGRPALGQAYRIITRSGIRIGLLGLTTQRVPVWEPTENVAGLKFASAFARAKYYAKVLRPRVDILAVIYHGGFEADIENALETEPPTGENEGYRILTEIPEVDVMLTGHQHRRLSAVKRGTAIVQPGYRGEAVGKVVVDIDETTKKIRSMSTALLDASGSKPDKGVARLGTGLNQATQKWLDQPIARLDKPAPIGRPNQARIEGAPFINLLQQMQLFFTGADISATAVMSETAPGFKTTVTMRDLILNYPYSNQLCVVSVTGSELRRIIEHSLAFLEKNERGGVDFAPKWRDQLFNFDVFYPLVYEADVARPVGQRLTRLELNGRGLEDSRTYRLAVNSYRACGGGFYPVYGPSRIENIIDKDYIQMFKEYLTAPHVKVDERRNYHFE